MNEISYMKNNVASADEFLGSIKASWHKTVEAVLETAQTLKTAEEQLPRKEFKALRDRLQQDRVMSGPTISKLLGIASNEILTAPENIDRLPPSYATLYELTRHDPKVVARALDDGLVNASTMQKDLVHILPPSKPKKMKTKQKIERISISVRFSAPVGDVPNELIERLQSVLHEIEKYTDVKLSGLNQ